MMDRSQSTSFQQVEDWLRGLGLLLYAQSFYDNGYEDIETCKEIKYEDLDVIGVKSDRDREDIIIAEIICAALEVNGVIDAEVTNFENNIVIADNQKARLDSSDLSIG